MRRFYIFICSILFVTAGIHAQSLLYTPADLQWVGGKDGEKRTDALLIFDKASGELRGSAGLLSLLPDGDVKDSLRELSPPFQLTFSGIFPIAQPEFFSAAENEKQVNMETKIQIGDSTTVKMLAVTLTMLRDKTNANPSGIESFVLPCRANFVIQIDPRQFGLHRKPLSWMRQLVLEVENGMINRK